MLLKNLNCVFQELIISFRQNKEFVVSNSLFCICLADKGERIVQVLVNERRTRSDFKSWEFSLKLGSEWAFFTYLCKSLLSLYGSQFYDLCNGDSASCIIGW